MSAVQVVTDQQVEDALARIEAGKPDKDDANLLRCYWRGLRSMLDALVAQSNEELIKGE